MMLYYQSFAVYFVALVIYVLLRLQFSGFNFKKVIDDPIFYLFIILIGYVLLSILYYLIKNKMIIIEDDKLVISSKFKTIEIPFDEIQSIKIGREHKFQLSVLLRTIKVQVKNDKRKTYVIRPYDFENDEELLKDFSKIKEVIIKSTEVKNAQEFQ